MVGVGRLVFRACGQRGKGWGIVGRWMGPAGRGQMVGVGRLVFRACGQSGKGRRGAGRWTGAVQ